MPLEILPDGLKSSVLVSEKQYNLNVIYSCGTTNYYKNSNGSHDDFSAPRLNISVATSAVIDSWEINSAAP